MATQIKKSKPTSPGRRFRSWVSRDDLHKGDPYAPLLETKKQKSGRNNQGRITTRHRGGGHKKHYRIIDFKRLKDGIPAKVETIEYDKEYGFPSYIYFDISEIIADEEIGYTLTDFKPQKNTP